MMTKQARRFRDCPCALIAHSHMSAHFNVFFRIPRILYPLHDRSPKAPPSDEPSRMVMFADDLCEWKDFPKGLRVLVLDEDLQSAAETKSKLEGFEYVVFTYSNEEDALAAIATQTNLFHVALVEVTTGNGRGGFRFLETACDLPTIMMSKMSCLSTMMKCLALGAAEFLQKPISEDKLKNIWQHVVHKAFSACETVLSDSLKPVKATLESMLNLGLDQAQVKNELRGADPSSGSKLVASASHKVQDYRIVPTYSGKQEANIELCNSEKFAAPSTPQLEQGGRSTSDDDIHEKALKLEYHTNLRTETWDAGNTFEWGATGEVKVDVEATSNWSSYVDSLTSAQRETQDLEQVSSKTRDTGQPELNSVNIKRGQSGYGHVSSAAESQSRLNSVNVHAVDDSSVAEEGAGSAGGSKSEEENVEKEAVASSHFYNEDNVDSSTEDIKRKQGNPDPGGEERKTASSKKKMKVDWTAELHRRFVQAVEQLGVDQAIPSKILELMKVDGLTRHNVASHLQKYRSHRRHVMSREDEATKRQSWKNIGTVWTGTKQDGHWSHYENPASRPVLGFPSTQLHPSPHGPPVGSSLHVWGHPAVDQSGGHMWQQSSIGTPTTWQASDGSLWRQPGMCIDARGCPLPGAPFCTESMMRMHSSYASAAIPDPKMPITAANGSIRQVSHFDPASNAGSTSWGNFIDVHPPKRVIDEAIKEALNNPRTPLPLGLKSPSIESVTAELQRQGIRKIPPPAS